MKLSLNIEGQDYQVHPEPRHIAIALHFDGPQPNTYGVPKASAKVYEQDGWVGDVRRGGSCNFETYTLTPHCNGTHTECVGHLTGERLQVHALLEQAFFPAVLITVDPRLASETADGYDPPLEESDRVLDRASLEAALEGIEPEFCRAVIVRTLPNDPGKLSRDYMQTPPPFFSLEGMAYLAELGVEHLLVDMPSVDRLFDEGKLRNHRTFWEVAPGSAELPEKLVKTITEMVYVPDPVPDGRYLLNLQVAPFMGDAAPSRPVLFSLFPEITQDPD